MKLKTKFWFLVGGVVLILLLIFIIGDFCYTGNAVSEGKSMNYFVNCLNEKGVLLYGFADHPQVRAQLDLFGNSSGKLNVVDCRASPEKCEGVIIYPSWRIDDRIISSGLSIGMLSDLSGCQLQ